MKLILLLTLEAITSASVIAPTPKVTSHCAHEEQVVFSCATTNSKVISLCSSSPLTSSDGYLQYRFGPADKLELVYPAIKEHPSKHFLFGMQGYAGGGSAFLKFMNGEYTYVLFDALIKGEGEKAGVVVSKSGKQIGYLPCKGAWRQQIGSSQFGEIKIPRDPNEDDFRIP